LHWPRRTALAALTASLIACGGGSEFEATTAAPLQSEGMKTVLASAESSPALTDAQALSYIASYSDLIEAFGVNPAAGRAHYRERAAIEGRVISFEPILYIASYADLINAFGANAEAGARHFILYGFAEGRSRGTFDTLSYVAANPSLIATIGTDSFAAARNYVFEGYRLGRPTRFDALRYIASYADLIQSLGIDPAAATLHFVRQGHPQGRDLRFDAERYLAAYSDLRAAFGNDLSAATRHFIIDGFRERRIDGVAFLPPPVVAPPPPPPPPPGPVTPPAPPPPPTAVADSAFLDSNIGWRVDILGKVSRTEDGGRTWIEVGALPVTGTIRLAFGTQSNGWALLVGDRAGPAPRVFRTTNGGASWTERLVPTPPPNPNVFTALKAIGDSTLIVTNASALASGTPDPSDPRQVIVTRDGGQLWFIRSFDPVHITGAGVLFGIAGGQVLRSTNLGQATTATSIAPDGTLLRIALFDEVNGLAVGRTSADVYAVWRTRDGGNTWLKLTSTGLPGNAACRTDSGQHSLTMSGTEAAVFGIGAGSCQARFRTIDGGSSWIPN
jgi:photosystem II stability/assembly factor-like uncharacterized protein